MKPTCTILILTYKGIDHLSHLLPSVFTAVDQASPFQFSVSIVDNAADDSTRNFVEQNFPAATYFPSEKNDYLFSLNSFVGNLKTTYTFILNDDMKIHPQAFRYALRCMETNDHLFSVNCHLMNWDGTGSQNNVRVLEYSSRSWYMTRWSDKKYEQPAYTLYGGGGSAVFRTALFNEMEGFDPIFRPAYCEDLDLGHRAWLAGFPSVFHPEAIIYHREGGTINQQTTPDRKTVQIYRNRIVEMVRNAAKPGFVYRFLVLLPIRLISMKKVDTTYHRALLKSLPMISRALRARVKSRPGHRMETIMLKKLGKPYEG